MHKLLARLTEPFEPKHISWKPGATKENKCMALAFADLRAYMDRLDEVCGLDWSVRYTFWGDNRIACELTLYVGDALGRREGITRSSTGEMDTQDEKNGMGGTVAEAQAFKRAATMFGLGRFLYDLPSVWVEFDPQRKRITEAGQRELDTRYTAWYAKKKAAQKPRPSRISVDEDSLNKVYVASGDHFVSDPDTGEIIDGDVVFTREPSSPKQPDRLSQAQLTKLNILGVDVHRNRWDAERPALVSEVTNGTTSSARELTPAQADVLIKMLDTELKHARNGKVAA